MSSVLITGGAGFIGSHLVDACVDRGDTVTVVDIARPNLGWENGAAHYIQRDIRDEHLADIFVEMHPEYVVHLAAHVDDRASVEEPVENAEHNILGTINVLDAARISGVRRLVFASTGVVYGEQVSVPIEEDATPRPLTPYAVSKITGERYARYFTSQLGLSTCTLRLGNVYGPRQDASRECGAVAIFTKKLLAGEAPFINGDGKTTRDYVYVKDVVQAFLQALESTEEGAVNIGTAREISTLQVLNEVAKHASSTVSSVSRKEVQDLVRHIALSYKKAGEVFGWKPTVSFEEGIGKTVAWYKSQM